MLTAPTQCPPLGTRDRSLRIVIASKRIRIALLVALAAALAATLVLLPVDRYLAGFLTAVKDIGPWGAAALALAYVPASLLFIPGSLLTLGAGFAFGVVLGTIAVSIGSVLGASAAFWLGRTVARGWVEERIAARPSFRAIDEAVGRQGFRIVLLTRLSPVFPFVFLNYAYGVTGVPFREYLLGSWIGMLPGTVLYVYLGSAVKSLAQLLAGDVRGGSGQTVFFALGLAATIAVTVLVTRTARRALHEAAPAAHMPS
ncbi:MAG: TVP38/TMEM64 family protein [Gemmatimonadetes bacterium]|nr:TVP38/TMEM64 family protein [Gemmatimonadota bacterium]